MKISHIGINVNDLYAMRLFYTKVFGFKEDYIYASKNTKGLKTVFLKKDGFFIELLKFEEPSKVVHGTCGYSHLSFEVQDVDMEEKRLKNFGVEISKSSRDTGDGYRELEIRDPEGNTIEISKRIKPAPFYQVKAVIFDLDGTIIDSEDNYYEADRQLLAKNGINFTQDMKKEFIGVGNLAMMTILKKRFSLASTVEELMDTKNKIYINIAKHNTVIYKSMLNFIELLNRKNIPMGLASGSSPEIIEELTSSLDLKKYFRTIVSAEDVGHSKPAPDIFLETAKRLGVEPHYCIVVEDSKYGVEAAKRAFMKCIAVPYLIEKPLSDSYLLADLIFKNGMKDFNYKKAFNKIIK